MTKRRNAPVPKVRRSDVDDASMLTRMPRARASLDGGPGRARQWFVGERIRRQVHNLHPVERVRRQLVERGRRATIGEHRAFAARVDDDHDRSGAAAAIDHCVDTARPQAGEQSVAGVVGADLADESAGTTGSGREGGDIGRAATASANDSRGGVGAVVDRLVQPHHHVFDEVTERAQHRVSVPCNHAPMDLEHALAFAAERSKGVLITLRSDGRAQSSNIVYVMDGPVAQGFDHRRSGQDPQHAP